MAFGREDRFVLVDEKWMCPIFFSELSMLNKKKIYVAAVILLGGAGLIIASVPFVGSLSPSETAKAEKAAWEMPPVPGLEPGQVLVRQVSESARREYPDGSWSMILGKRDILIRDIEGVYHSFRVPTWKDKVILPRRYWGQWDGECEKFGPKTMDGVLAVSAIIECNDATGSWWDGAEPKWSLEGKSLVEPYPDLPKLRCRHESGEELTCY